VCQRATAMQASAPPQRPAESGPILAHRRSRASPAKAAIQPRDIRARAVRKNVPRRPRSSATESPAESPASAARRNGRSSSGWMPASAPRAPPTATATREPGTMARLTPGLPAVANTARSSSTQPAERAAPSSAQARIERRDDRPPPALESVRGVIGQGSLGSARPGGGEARPTIYVRGRDPARGADPGGAPSPSRPGDRPGRIAGAFRPSCTGIRFPPRGRMSIATRRTHRGRRGPPSGACGGAGGPSLSTRPNSKAHCAPPRRPGTRA